MMGEQVSERDDLARAIDPEAFKDHPIESRSSVANVQWSARRMFAHDAADAALAWFAEHQGPRVVSTIEELDALPVGSVVRSGDGQIWQRVGSGWDCLSEDGTGGSYPSETVIFQTLPPTATVLFTPTTESEDR